MTAKRSKFNTSHEILRAWFIVTIRGGGEGGPGGADIYNDYTLNRELCQRCNGYLHPLQ